LRIEKERKCYRIRNAVTSTLTKKIQFRDEHTFAPNMVMSLASLKTGKKNAAERTAA
jgi:hypothetical protein